MYKYFVGLINIRQHTAPYESHVKVCTPLTLGFSQSKTANLSYKKSLWRYKTIRILQGARMGIRSQVLTCAYQAESGHASPRPVISLVVTGPGMFNAHLSASVMLHSYTLQYQSP